MLFRSWHGPNTPSVAFDTFDTFDATVTVPVTPVTPVTPVGPLTKVGPTRSAERTLEGAEALAGVQQEPIGDLRLLLQQGA